LSKNQLPAPPRSRKVDLRANDLSALGQVVRGKHRRESETLTISPPHERFECSPPATCAVGVRRVGEAPCKLTGRTRFARHARKVGWRVFFAALVACAATPPPACRGDDIQAAAVDVASEPIAIHADACTHWKEGVYDVWHLQGHCELTQGLTYARGPEAVVWVDSREAPAKPTKVIAYFESGVGERVAVEFRNLASPDDAGGLAGQQRSSSWFQRLSTNKSLVWRLPAATELAGPRPPIYDRGLEQFNPDRRREILLAQYSEPLPPPAAPTPLPAASNTPGMRSFQLFQRNDSPNNIKWKQLQNGENAAIISGGVRLLIEGLPTTGLPGGFGPLGVVDISTDRAVIWASDVGSGADGAGMQSHDAPLEIYMEGNIEFRQGDRIVYADRMFYDVRRQIGVILNAELLTPLPNIEGYQYQGLVRLKAQALRQLDQTHFAATNALLTTSRIEEPSYDISAREINFTDVEQSLVDPLTGAPVIGPDGRPVSNHQQLAEASGNVVHVRGVPVFYWPRFATDLTKPSFVIDRVRVGNDSIFGTQAMVDWDMFQLLGVRNKPLGTRWGLSTDYLSDRGIGVGTDFHYDRPELFGFVGPAKGYLDAWGIKDDGLDNLGFGRRTITPEEDFRYRLFGNHRQRLESGWEITAESGLLSDRTFLEQYYEREWDELKDPRTGLGAKRITNNRELAIQANAQVNDFFTENQLLPRADHYWLGESLLGDRLTWFEHSQAAYADLNVATTPTEPTLNSQFVTLPWEKDVNGERFVTRQEIDLPVQLGVVKVVPFALGELAHWGEALDGNSLDRGYVNAGVRASIPMWAIYPDVRDPLFNLNGLAHKVTFDAELSYADANENFDELPLYDALDDISIIEMRRRLNSGALPPTITDPKFDPRTFALRSGLQNWVTSPSTEIADDLLAMRMGVRQRWQTKRGPAGAQHIVDWLTLDMNATYFPEADRDNFGAELGLIDYDMRWYVGDRFTILSDGFADVFGSGLKTASAGVLLNRPTLGNAYLGVRSIDGPITSNVILGSYSYRLSQKWISTASTAVDLSNAGNIGQTFSMTRIGDAFLVTVGMNVDSAKNNVGVHFQMEPRFLPKLRLTQQTGIEVPPSGALGLE
jgi:hypothetical protein